MKHKRDGEGRKENNWKQAEYIEDIGTTNVWEFKNSSNEKHENESDDYQIFSFNKKEDCSLLNSLKDEAFIALSGRLFHVSTTETVTIFKP